MLRRAIFVLAYLFLAAVALMVAFVLQTVLSVPILKAALSGDVDRLQALGTLATVWVVFGVLSLIPLWLARRQAPHLATLALSPLILGTGGFVQASVALLSALPDRNTNSDVTFGTSPWSAVSTVLIIATVLLHLVVAFRMARSDD